MKTILLLLLLTGAARAQTPAPSRTWHLGEPVREATDRQLSEPGWTLQKSDENSCSFVSTDGRRHITYGVRDGKVVQITLAAPAGGGINRFVLKDATQIDSYHWQNAREHALITRSYTGELEVYRVEWVPTLGN